MAHRPSPTSATLLGWWLDRRVALGRLPARRDLDPADLKKILPHLFLAAVEPTGYRFRLFGTGIVDAMGHDATGRPVDAHSMGTRWAGVVALYDRVVATAAPLLSLETAVHADDFSVRNEVTHVPLSADGDRVDMILGSLVRVAAGGNYQRVPERDTLVWTPEATFTLDDLDLSNR